MNTLFCLRGLPASGKSTWAAALKGWAPTAYVTSRDDIRREVFGLTTKGVLPPEQEDEVTRIQHTLVKAALKAGRTVVVDNTNLRAKYLHEWARLASELGVGFRVEDFDVPVDECVRRDAKRETPVGEDVIRALDKRFRSRPEIPFPQPTYADLEPYVPNHDLIPAVVFDIDGTLADSSHRDPYDATKAGDDGVIEHAVHALSSYLTLGYVIVFLSSRSEKHREVTEAWLAQRIGINAPLFMRGERDGRPDWQVKHDLFMDHVARDYNVYAVFDDRLQVRRMWHAIGAPLFSVGDPDADF